MRNLKRRFGVWLLKVISRLFKAELQVEVHDKAVAQMAARIAFLEQQNACLSHSIGILSGVNAELKKSRELYVNLGVTDGVEINRQKMSLN